MDRRPRCVGWRTTNNSCNVEAEIATANPATLTKDGAKSILTATGGTPPYNWSVVDASLGHILGSATGNSVVYVRDHAGDVSDDPEGERRADREEYA